MGSESSGRTLPVGLVDVRSIGGILVAGAVNNLVALLMTILAARELGPRDFGQLGLMLAVMMFASTVLDCGTSVSVVRSYQVDDTGRPQLLRVVLGWKWSLAILVTALALPLSGPASRLFFGGAGTTAGEFAWTMAGAGLMAIWVSVRALFQARKEFVALSVVSYLYAFVRIAALLVAVLMQRQTAVEFFVAIYVLPLLVLLPVTSFLLVRRSREEHGGIVVRDTGIWWRVRELLRYGRWVALSSACYAFLWRLPQFRLGHAGDPAELGYYTAGLTFIAVFSLLNDSVRTVILPRVAAMRGNEDRQRFRGVIRRWVAWYYGGMALLVAVLLLLQAAVLGPEYRSGMPIFLVMSLGTVLTLHAGLLNSLVHSHGLPHIDAAANVLKVLVLGAVMFLVPPQGLAVAAAFAAVMAAGEWTLTAVVLRREACHVTS